MGTPGGTAAVRAAKAAPPAFAEANFFELRRGTSKISFTVSNIAGEPVLSYGTQTFTGREVRIETTEIGTLVTVTLSAIPDLETRLLTLVLPLVQVGPATPEKVSVPVIFTRVEMSIAGRPLHPGPVQTYDVKIYTGKASFIVS
ncbi:MAG TPA: hypothetical protein VJ725_24455 [Thermoanaerobaculia bacterium]|nr:hypothetical protein [Thermoanaerobaculia bacterium]